MKKAIVSFCVCIAISFLCICLLSAEIPQAEVIEGYGDLPWGSSIEDVQKKYKNVEEIASNNLAYGEKIFEQINESTIRYFRFYNDELYWAKIAYINPTTTMSEALAEKLIEIYGKFDGSDEYIKNNTITSWISRNYSSKLEIILTTNDLINNLGYIRESIITVEYLNPLTEKEIFAEEVEREKSEIEL